MSEKKGIEAVDMQAELDRAINEILETDPRQDQFRSLKALLIYQAAMMEDILKAVNAIGSILVNGADAYVDSQGEKE